MILIRLVLYIAQAYHIQANIDMLSYDYQIFIHKIVIKQKTRWNCNIKDTWITKTKFVVVSYSQG